MRSIALNQVKMKNIKNQLSIKTVLRTDKKNVEDNSPIYFRLSINNSEANFSTKIFVDADRWKTTKGFKQTNKKDEQQIRFQIEKAKEELKEIAEQFQKDGESFNAEMVKNKFFGIDETIEKQHTSILQMFGIHQEHFMKKYTALNIQKGFTPDKAEKDAKLSHNKYNSVKQKLVEFLKEEKKQTDIPLGKLDDNFQEEFLMFLQRKLSNNTSIKYFTSFNWIVRFSVKKKYLKEYPFEDNFHLRMSKSKTASLTVEEINKIANKKFATERLTVVRDIFLFGILTGYSYQELMSIKRTDIVQSGKMKMIVAKRKKSGNDENVPLVKEAEQLINKYWNYEYCISTGKLFPSRSNDKLNEYLKEIASLCGITKNLSTKVSRKTFATTLSNNKVEIKSISKLLGHSRTQTTEQFYIDTNNGVLEDGVSKGFKGVFKIKKAA